MTDFDEIINGQQLAPDEEERMRKVHDLLLEEGPPPELPPSLARPPSVESGHVLRLPAANRAGLALVGVAAAAAAAAAFAIGYVVHGGAPSYQFDAARVVQMHGNGDTGTIRLAAADKAGNWTMLVTLHGLRPANAQSYYTLWLTRGGKPLAVCGTFKSRGNATTVWFNAPFQILPSDGWVVTTSQPGEAGPGRVVMTA